ncbi:MAG: hypothetical protein AB1758_03380 [Candidatus Eremiobacterota bacterium]
MEVGPSLEQAAALVAGGKPKEALALYQRVLTQDPLCQPAHDSVFQILGGPSQNLDLVEFYRDLLKVHQDDVELTIRLARAYAQGGKDSLAVLQIQKILKKDPHPKAFAELARIYGRMQKIRMALEAINNAIAIDPGYGPAHRERVRLLASSGEREEAAIHAVDSLAFPQIDSETRTWLETVDAFLEAGHNPPDAIWNGKH